jgi:hypothetical protein
VYERIGPEVLARGRSTPSAGGRRLGAVLAVRVRGDSGGAFVVRDPARGRLPDADDEGMPPDGERSCERTAVDGDRSLARTPLDGDRSWPRTAPNEPVFAAVAPDEFRLSVSRGTPVDWVIVRGALGAFISLGVAARPLAGSVPLPSPGSLGRDSGLRMVGASVPPGRGMES